MKVHLKTILRLWKLLSPFHFIFYIQIGLIFLLQLLGTSFTILFSKVIDALIAKDTDMLLILVSLFPLIAGASVFIRYISDKNEAKHLNGRIQQHLEEYSFKKIFSLNAFQYLESHSAIKLQVINRGEGAVQDIIQTLLLQGLPVIFSLSISLVAISFYSIPIGLWTAATLVLLVTATIFFNRFFNPLQKKNMDNFDIQRKVRTEAFSHLPLIKLSGQEDAYLTKYLARRLEFITFSIYIWVTNAKYINGRNFFIYLSRFVSLLIVIYLFMNGEVTVGVVYAIFSWTTDIYNNIGSINAIFRQIPLRFLELEKYLTIIDQKATFDEELSRTTHSGDIIFNSVSFSYPSNSNKVLDAISFTIEHGKKTAFVGVSGSGKSTITKLLLRMYDWQDGDITLGGASLREQSSKELRHRIGYVEQHVDLFDDTLYENIIFSMKSWKEHQSNEHMDIVLKLSRVDQFFHRLGEKRLETIIGEHGIKLSGGERQRVGIARAIIKNPDILIFDEATSTLDTENEKHVMDAIKEVSKGKTTILIAHRLSTVRDADKIIVMDKGRVVGEGTHDELIAHNEYYKNLVAHQV